MQAVCDNVWQLRYPLSLMGTQIGRNVTIIRLASGEIVVHSTAPFSPKDAAAIQSLGGPVTLLEATLFHDTFAAQGRAAFPNARYLAPAGFTSCPAAPFTIINPATQKKEWGGELEIVELGGMPRVREHLLFHRVSRTLIVADLVFNFGPEATPWTRFIFRHLAGIRHYPGVSRLFRLMIRDPKAFQDSLRRVLEWDFDRVMVGHGDSMEKDGKALLARALERMLS